MNPTKFVPAIVSLDAILEDIKAKLELSKTQGKQFIDLNPPYQRGVVWSVDQQRKLIDSVLRKYPIPTIFFRKVNPSTLECVDGKQRLTALLMFYCNELAIPNDGYGTIQNNPQ